MYNLPPRAKCKERARPSSVNSRYIRDLDMNGTCGHGWTTNHFHIAHQPFRKVALSALISHKSRSGRRLRVRCLVRKGCEY